MCVIKFEGNALRRGGPCARPHCRGCGPQGGPIEFGCCRIRHVWCRNRASPISDGRPYEGECLCRPFNLVDALIQGWVEPLSACRRVRNPSWAFRRATDHGHARRLSPFLIRHRPGIRVSHRGGMPLGFRHGVSAAPVDLCLVLSCSLHGNAAVPVTRPIEHSYLAIPW
jgi:hypothetical protein